MVYSREAEMGGKKMTQQCIEQGQQMFPDDVSQNVLNYLAEDAPETVDAVVQAGLLLQKYFSGDLLALAIHDSLEEPHIRSVVVIIFTAKSVREYVDCYKQFVREWVGQEPGDVKYPLVFESMYRKAA